MRRYDLTTKIYDDRYCKEQEVKYHAVLGSLKLDECSVVLDVGCGTGLFFNHISERVGTIVGVDVSKRSLRLAKERVKSSPNVHLVVADADNLPVRQNFFSLICAFTVLQNMPKPADTLKQLKLAGRSDAYFVITGLKAAISLETLCSSIKSADLKKISILDEEPLKCNIVICTNNSEHLVIK
jgi:ubiquinone/menaquinone biosynthesis C-methylase UbiE